MPEHEWLDVAAAAERHRCSTQTIWRSIRQARGGGVCQRARRRWPGGTDARSSRRRSEFPTWTMCSVGQITRRAYKPSERLHRR